MATLSILKAGRGLLRDHQLLVNRRVARRLQLQPKQEIVNRPYQLEAAARVMESFDQQKKRKL